MILQVPDSEDGQRLDRVLHLLYPQYSRSRLQKWIREGLVRLNRMPAELPRQPVRAGDRVELRVPQEPATQDPRAEDISLDVVHEDEALIVINKPPGLVVQPGAGHSSGTLVNALLHHDPQLQKIPRAGLVHRLDKDTSGLLLVARQLQSHNTLVRQMQRRAIKRSYQAVVAGVVERGGTVNAALGRDPARRTRIAVRANGRVAISHYRVLERFARHTLLQVHLQTGRTHQIRVHLAWLGHPVLGDPTYGPRRRGSDATLPPTLRLWRRQALHAWRLQLPHPLRGDDMDLQVEPPADMQALLRALREPGATT